MSRTTQDQKQAIADTFDAAKQAAIQAAVKSDVAMDDGKMLMKNRDGKMLMCNLTVQQRIGAPDPLCVTVNEEIRWLKRGMKAVVPWYVVLHLNNNIERRYRQQKDENGKNQTITEDGPSEPISYSLINPADDNPAIL